MGIYYIGICLLVVLGATETQGEQGSACYGRQSCDFYQLNCAGTGEIIKLNSLSAGRKNQTECHAADHCSYNNGACCSISDTDVLEEFNKANQYAIHRNCSAKTSCANQAPWQLMTLSTTNVITSTYAHIDYDCVKRTNILNFCGTENGASSAIGQFVEVMFDGSRKSFDPLKASKECECTVQKSPDTGGFTVATIIDMRLVSYKEVNFTAVCSSATFSSPMFSAKCADTTNRRTDNFYYNKQYSFAPVPGGNKINIRDIHLNGMEDSPAIVWMSFQGSNSDVSVSCREVIPAVFTTTTTSTTTTTPKPTTNTFKPTTTTPKPTTTTPKPTTTTSKPTTTTPKPTTTTPKPTTTTSKIDDDLQHAQLMMAIFIPIAVVVVIIICFSVWVFFTKRSPRQKKQKFVMRDDAEGLKFYNNIRNVTVRDNYVDTPQRSVYAVDSNHLDKQIPDR